MNREAVKIVEVGPRDGLQNEKEILSVADRVEFVRRLILAGNHWLEGGSFVSPKAIPQMIDSEQVFSQLKNEAKAAQADLSFLVANEKGLERAKAAGVNSIAVFTATSNSFTTKNIQRSVDESISEFSKIAKEALALKMQVRGYISTAFGCPYEGRQDPQKVVRLAGALFDMGCFEVSVGDTIGVAHPRQIRDVFSKLKTSFGLKQMAAHLHDTRGAALLNIREALNVGVRIFDSSAGGLGGCPYAPGASGNVASEEVVWFLEGEGFTTGVNLEKLLDASQWMEGRLGRPLHSKLYQSKKKPYYFDEEQKA